MLTFSLTTTRGNKVCKNATFSLNASGFLASPSDGDAKMIADALRVAASYSSTSITRRCPFVGGWKRPNVNTTLVITSSPI
jgi:hypothetical protein